MTEIDPEVKRRACVALARHATRSAPLGWSTDTADTFAGWHFSPYEEWLLVYTSGGYGGPVQYLVREDTVFVFSLAEHSYESALAAARAHYDRPARRWWRFGRS
ncbi:hypothetical protein [Crossiella sp. NPDC003009]